MDVPFPEVLLAIGLLVATAAALSGLMHGTVLSISVLAVAAGMVLALADVITVDPGSPGLVELIELALILTLFSDGLLVERELLQRHWQAPARALVVAMPVTLVLLAVGGKLLFSDLSWAEAFLLGAVLAPTDPVVTSSVVSSAHVPASVRHALNIESGLNDGLALPFVLFFLVLVEAQGGAGSELTSLIGEAAAGVAIGAGLGFLAGLLIPRLPGGPMTHRYEGLYALGLGLIAFAAAELTIGNGLIAVFVAGITLAAAEQEVQEAFVSFNENLSSIFQVVTFFAFGALIVSTGWAGAVWPILVFVPFALLLARPVAVRLALLGTALPRVHRAFIAWFGPKGVASMLFALFVLHSEAPGGALVFDIAAFVILGSIVAHGLTDTVGARWIDRRLSDEEAAGEPG